MTYRIRVTKGCPAIAIPKNSIARIAPQSVDGYGVRAGTVAGTTLWFSGNRVHAPVLRVGQSIRLNDGYPSHTVVAEVEEVYYPAPE